MPLSVAERDALRAIAVKLTADVANISAVKSPMATDPASRLALSTDVTSLVGLIDKLNPDQVVPPPVPKPTIALFVATPANIQVGRTSTLTAQITNGTVVTLDGVSLRTFTTPTAGVTTISVDVTPTANRTYTLVATNASGNAQATVDVRVFPLPVLTVTASASTITAGQSTTLTIGVANAVTLSFDGDALPIAGPVFSKVVTPTANHTYAFVATGLGGSTSVSVAIQVTPVVIVPPPPPPPAGPNPLYTMYDGPTGIGPWGWNHGGNVWWSHKGGDWVDASGAPNGSQPMATLTQTALSGGRQALSGDVSALLRKWLKDGNTGAIGFVVGGGAVAGRTNTGGPPELWVDGVRYRCTAATVINTGQDGPMTKTSDDTLNPSYPLALQLDLTGLTATFGWAQLLLYAWNSTISRVDLYPFVVPNMLMDPVPTSTEDWSKRTDFIIHGDWQPDMSALLPEGQMAGDTVFGSDPVMGRTATFTFKPGQYEPISAEWRFSSHGQPAPRALYVASMIRLDTRTSYYQARKIGMGISGRYGYLENGHYTPVDGNGGNPTDGYWHAAGTGPNKDNAHQNAYISGWSMRPWLAQAANNNGVADPANPLYDWGSLQTYAYHIPMELFGDNFVWRCLIKVGKPYCMLQFVQMNTVSNPDANGNGVGRNDGIYRSWLNGFLVYERTDMCWTHNANVADDEIWCDFYEGGQLDPIQTTKASMGMFAASLNPIKPPSTFLLAPPVITPPPPIQPNPVPSTTSSGYPAWRKNLNLRAWFQIPNTALINADMSALIALGYNSQDLYGSPNNRFLDYSGACMDAADLDAYGGGGAGANAANYWARLLTSTDAPKWSVLFAPSPASAVPARDGSGATLRWTNFDNWPIAIHSYKGVWKWKGKGYVIFQQNGWVYDGGRNGDVWCRDTSGWTKVATLPDRGGGGWDGPGMCQERTTGRIYITLGGTIEYFDPNDNSVGSFWTDSTTTGGWGLGGLDQALPIIMGGKLYTFGTHGGDGQVWLLAIDMTTRQATRTLVPAFPRSDVWKLNGSLETDGTKLYGFVDDGNVYAINLDGSSSAVATTGTAPVPGHSAAKHGDGPKTRFRYVPELGGFLLVQAADTNAYFLPMVNS